MLSLETVQKGAVQKSLALSAVLVGAGVLLFEGATAKAQSVELVVSEEVLVDAASVEIAVEEVPEEILRTEIITAARSPLTGKPLSAVEYAQLQAELAGPAGNTLVSEDLRYLIFLLQVRRAIKPILPFVR